MIPNGKFLKLDETKDGLDGQVAAFFLLLLTQSTLQPVADDVNKQQLALQLVSIWLAKQRESAKRPRIDFFVLFLR